MTFSTVLFLGNFPVFFCHSLASEGISDPVHKATYRYIVILEKTISKKLDLM